MRRKDTKKNIKEEETVKTYPNAESEIVVANITNFINKFINSKIQAKHVYSFDK
jgi:hypothetical protein